MKITRRTQRTVHHTEGGAMLLPIAVIVALIMGVALAAYLKTAGEVTTKSARLLSWNSAMPVLESGIEEAITHVNDPAVGTNWAQNGWSLTNGAFRKSRSVNDGQWQVAISNSVPPVIYSIGSVQIPLQEGGFVSRTVRVETARMALFAKAMVAKGDIDLKGNNVLTDSFDSMDPNYSTGGLYDPAKSKDGGDVATNSGVINSLNVGNADIFGKVSTGPGGTVAIGPNGTVGDSAWHAGGNSGVQPGWSSDDMNVSFPDVTPPFTSGTAPSGGNVGGTNYKYILGSGNYMLSSMSLNGQDKVLVQGDAVLYVTGSVSMSGQSQIIIENTGTVNLYVGGGTASISGGGVVNNPGNATSFIYWGLPTNTRLNFSGNADFTGSIYAPEAELHLNGSGNSTYDIVGATVSDTVQMNGRFQFHYDENLGREGPSGGFLITSWQEI